MSVERWPICAVINLAIIVLSHGLTIDNQLTVIRNDCYERMAIGEKLDPKDVDETLTVSTVQDCQMACTQEEEKCRSFSFGVSVKGNATCELSKKIIKETPDLKPIGTVSDVDFDLYIKKLGCKLVVTDSPSSSYGVEPEKPLLYNQDDKNKPSYPSKPSNEYPTSRPSSYYNKPARPSYTSDKPFQVQSTLISVASGPNQSTKPPALGDEKPNDRPSGGYGYGKPYYPNRFTGPGGYGDSGDRPPFRPPYLNHPYDYRPSHGDGGRPDFDRNDRPYFGPNRPLDDLDLYDRNRPNDVRPYDSRPPRPYHGHELRPHGDYDEPRPHRPPQIPDRPLEDGYDRFRPHRPHRPNRPSNDDYSGGSRPHRPPQIPDRPIGDEYGSSRPPRPPIIPDRPLENGYGDSRPHRPPEIPDRPSGGGYDESRPHRPPHIPDRPLGDDYDGFGPHRPPPDRPLSDDYGNSRPHRPPLIPDRPLEEEYGPSRPHRPPILPDRPVDDGYGGSRPYRPDRPPLGDEYGPSRPQRPPVIPDRPLEDDYSGSGPHRPPQGDEYGGSRPHRPPIVLDRPLGDEYGQSRPQRPPVIPERPLDDDYGGSRPHRPPEIPDRPPLGDEYDGSRPHRPPIIPDRPPLGDEYGGSRPHRPPIVPDRPLGDEYGPSRPQRPPVIPDRPLGDDYGGSRPHRPPEIPDRPPLDDEYGGSRPHRPSHIPDRPFEGDYGVSRPERPPVIPDRPSGDSYGGPRPHRPSEIPNRPLEDGYDGSRPHRPPEIPARPLGDDYGGPRPHRPPAVLPDRPGEDGYGESRPHRPPEVPHRPLGDGYGSGRPHRPPIVPDRPSSDGYGESRPDKPIRPDGYDNNRPNRPDYYGEDNFGGRPYGPGFAYDRYGYPPPDRRPIHSGPNEIPDYTSYGAKPLRPEFDADRPFRGDQVYGYGSLSSSYGNKRVDYFGSYRRRPYPPRLREPPNVNASLDRDKSDNKNNSDVQPSDNNSSANQTDSSNSGQNLRPGEPIVTHTQGPHGETITSIITEITQACFRRVLAGKRVVRAFVRRTAPCERVDDCQRECSDEKRFVCEGFNYRLDPAGRAQGDCELIDLPLSRLDIRRDVYDDPDYDYYERDRNSNVPDCKGHKYYGSYGDYGSYQSDNKYDYYDYYGQGGYYDDYHRGDGYRYNYRQPRPDEYEDGYRYYNSNRRGDYDFHSHHQYDDNYDYGFKYDRRPPPPDYKYDDDDYKPRYPPPPYDDKSYEPYLPHGHWRYERPSFNNDDEYWRKYFDERAKDKNYWGFKKDYGSWGSYGGAYGNFGAPDSYYFHDEHHHKNSNRHDYDYYDYKYYLGPQEYGGSKDWGRYGGSYGYGGQRREYESNDDGYDYWGFNRYNKNGQSGLLPPYPDRPVLSDTYLPPYDEGFDYLDIQHRGGYHDDHYDHHVHEHDFRNLYKDECSLRMVTGFRLHKGIVKKLIAVPSIYECELLCYKEKDFPCTSYAYRYTVIPGVPLENCYLSDRNYKELDYYTDLEPDRDCDIYTLHNRNRCEQPVNPSRYNSDCFWRVRSGQRLDQRIVKDSLNVKSIVECQLECLRALTFTCRAFSFRYGSPVIGGAIDNCQLTDWPFSDLDPRIHLIPENGFEMYERGSYGHGCEPYHFQFGKKPDRDPGDKLDQICYLGYGSPARLLPQATKKSLRVETEAECKAECTKARDKSLFQCMSLSYRTLTPRGSPNCDLSDIVQRDLLSNVDYVSDPDSWLFAWDLHNPRCVLYIAIGSTEGGGYDNDGGGHGNSGGGYGNSGGGYGNSGGGYGNSGGGYGSNSGGGISGSGGIGGNTNGIGGSGGTIGGGSGGGYGDNHDHYKGVGSLLPWFNPGFALETWRIYSVGGLPCKRGSLCQENKVAGFWYCELEGREEHSWDYCCRPDHQCGYSEGFPYQWCHVGPGRTQWRKCNDRYYPYTHNANDRFDTHHTQSHVPHQGSWSSNSVGSNHIPDHLPYRPSGFRPDRPAASPSGSDDYESQSNNHFLDPPKPGGFGQARHWPISYLHKEVPPNDTFPEQKFDYMKVPKGRNIDTKYEAIANLIDVIKSNDLKDIRYQISNNSDKSDDILYVQIPLPSNFSGAESKQEKITDKEKEDVDKLEAVDIFLPTPVPTNKTNSVSSTTNKSETGTRERKSHLYTRSYITKTNRTRSNQRQTKNTSRGSIELVPSV